MDSEKLDPQTKSIPAKKQDAQFVDAHGRRKGAVARVRLFKGKGSIIVNNKPIDEYYPDETSKIKWQRPFNVTKSEGQYYATIKVAGSGKSSQVGAIIHGLARALLASNPQYRQQLRRAGLLTRDSRVRERRKYGLAQKARKGKQSPKR